MKIQYKAAWLMSLFGIVIVTLLTLGYEKINQQAVMEQESKNLAGLAEEVAAHLDSHLKERVVVSRTLSTANLIHQALLTSNGDFSSLPDAARGIKIQQLNDHWIARGADDASFIASYLNNPVAKFLRAQQEILPDYYGEIFLTNRYGALVASTGRLTTLAHAHKYWWKEGYNQGVGRVFLDDRGFDMSVKGYVLGIVVPVRQGDEVIGILKCNVNILGALTDVINEFVFRHEADIRIVRTAGKIVAAPGIEPLSSSIDASLSALLQSKDQGRSVVAGGETLVAYASIASTLNSNVNGFGGKSNSIDHFAGNQNESWHILLSLGRNVAMQKARSTTTLILMIGVCFTLLSTIAAWLLGRWVAAPIVQLAKVAKSIGEGDLKARVDNISSDEIGLLANTLNKMAENLQQTMISRDKLQLLAMTDELTGIYNRREFNARFKREVDRAHRYQVALSLLMLDIDYFKKINDQFGHDVGDQVLTKVVEVINRMIRKQDLVARWGGEEFTILLPHTKEHAASLLAMRLKEAVASSDFSMDKSVTVSLGVAELLGDMSAHTLLIHADNALYQAKELGRNRVFCYSEF